MGATMRLHDRIKASTAKDLRKKAGMNQAEFWESLGASQSSGSRYESGANRIPTSVCILIHLVHIKHLNFKQLARLTLKDLQVIKNLRGSRNQLFHNNLYGYKYKA